MDRHTPEQRHYNMSQVKSKNTKPEKMLMKVLRDKGIWFTHHRTDVFGKPDIVFKRKKIAIFVDSDFWHGHAPLPKTNQEFWKAKLERNRQRDDEVNAKLIEQEWMVIRFSENEIKKDLAGCVEKILISINLKN